MKMKTKLLISLFTTLSLGSHAQHASKHKITFPKVNDYLVLKADFHMHSIYSDGSVHPSERVFEAYNEDLDAISLTDHIEYQRYIKEVPESDDLNKSFTLIKPIAESYDIICIKGTEITRDVPPGHTNAIFITDANQIATFNDKVRPNSATGYKEAVQCAKQQGGFTFYNHPFHNLPDNNITLPDQVKELIEEKQIDGIEIVNGDRFSKEGIPRHPTCSYRMLFRELHSTSRSTPNENQSYKH